MKVILRQSIDTLGDIGDIVTVRDGSAKIAAELEKHESAITIPMQVGEEDKLFGSVTKEMIADKLAEKGFNIDRRKIEIEEPIKTLGIFTIDVKLHSNVTGKIKVWVVRQ